MNVDVSPDGGMLIFDLLGDIFWLPMEGGDAVSLTTGRAWDQSPRFSPDGSHVYFISDRNGHKNIWRLALADRSLQQVTRSESDIVGGPNWSQDGSHLLVGRGDPKTRNTEFILHSVDPDTGDMTSINAPSGPWVDLDSFETLRPRVIIYSGAESSDGDVFYSQPQYDLETRRVRVRMHIFNLHTQTSRVMTRMEALYNEYKPQLSHDGNLLAYFRQYNDRRTEVRILNRTTGQDEALMELTNADDARYSPDDDSRPNYAFTPDDRNLVFWHGGKIHRASLLDGSSDVIPFRVKVRREVWERAKPAVRHLRDMGEAKIIRWPSLSRDGETMVFAAIGYIWVMDVESGTAQRLTRSTEFEYMPALSPDGTAVAYISFAQSDNEHGSGRLVIADIDGGKPRDLLANPNETYLLPKWSPDGQKIAVIREFENEGGLEAVFGWTSTVSSLFHRVAAAPASSDRASLHNYARYVGFDEYSRNLLFSYPRSKTETVLASAGLDGSPLQTLAFGTPEVGGITPAPDLNQVVLTRDDGTVWVAPFDVASLPRQVSTTSPDTRQIDDGGGYYVDWNRSNQFTFGVGQNVYRYRLDEGELESLRAKVPFEKPKAAQPIAFTGARLITLSNVDGAASVIESGIIVVDGSRIAGVGPINDVVIPSDALVIDVTGKTIMPGLLDTHYHRIGGWSLSAFALPNDRFNDRSAIHYGVTTAWEPGGAVDDGVPATVDLQRAGRVLGPRWSHAAEGRVGFPWQLLTTYTAALAAVERHKELGVDVLKEYNTPTRKQRQWLSAAALESGLGIISHIQSFDGMMTRIVDGYTGGDHPYIPVPFYKDVRELLKQTGYIWTPNIAITSGTVGTLRLKKDHFCHAVLTWQKRTNFGHRNGEPICPPEEISPAVPYHTHRVSRVATQAASAANNGIRIGVSAHGMPGSKLHREMWHLWKGGLPIEEVLRATTMGNANKLGLQKEVGSLEAGKVADFLVLDENPLKNILNTLSLKYTVQGGVVYCSNTAQRADLNKIREPDAAVPQYSGQTMKTHSIGTPALIP